MKLIGLLILIVKKILSRFEMYFLKPLFKTCGKNVIFSAKDFFSYSNISIGDNVYIGPGAHFSSIKEIRIGNKVMFGPNVTLIGGDHNANIVGEYMFDIKNKQPENDLPIIIEEDVWVGANVTILKGVTIMKGSIIAAGSLVNKDIEPYSIVAGVPAKMIRKRFNESELNEHVKLMSKK